MAWNLKERETLWDRRWELLELDGHPSCMVQKIGTMLRFEIVDPPAAGAGSFRIPTEGA